MKEVKKKGMSFYWTGVHKAGCLISRATKFLKVVPYICVSSFWNLQHVTLLAPKMVRWFLDFWRICSRL